MKNSYYFLFSFTILMGVCTLLISQAEKSQTNTSDTAKTAIRDIGHNLLLSANDSTSLVMPVKELTNNSYELTFENMVVITPDSLMLIAERSLSKASLNNSYRAQVIQCTDGEIAYSYEIQQKDENSIVPCMGRNLPLGCYKIRFYFIENKEQTFSNDRVVYYGLTLGFLLLTAVLYKKKSVDEEKHHELTFNQIGMFKFFPDQNMLLKESEEIALSKKECELLTLFIERPNEIIKRDELTKKVWEDHGVFVGRSLDTYVSKLRKKLQDDKTIKLTNIHGVGYKLEV